MIGSRRGYLALAAACLLLLIEATTLIRTRWVEDESWIASNSWTFAQEGRIRTTIFPSQPGYEIAVGPPVYTVTEGYWFAAFGLGIAQARLLSALAGMITLIVVFFLGREIGGTLCGAVAGAIAASDTFLVVAARTARPEAETMLLCWLAILLYLLAVRRESPILALASGGACGLGLLCHPLACPSSAACASSSSCNTA